MYKEELGVVIHSYNELKTNDMIDDIVGNGKGQDGEK